MKLNHSMIFAILVPLSTAFYGCASSPNNASTTGKNNSTAEKKISMAIGQEISDFSIVNQINTDAPMGYIGTQYTVNSKNGKTYKCEILENSGFGKVMTLGTGTGAGAMCTDFTKGSKDAGKTNAASCNALLKAAGKC